MGDIARVVSSVVLAVLAGGWIALGLLATPPLLGWAAVAALGFRSLTIAQPSLLLGPRPERRFGEQIGKVLGVLAPERWRPVLATSVASALVAAARRDEPGVHVLDNRALRRAT